ncbi:bifunctional diaminohydroxyphosphoribosylaminopyrimidine deaminase/5-amino-6-(5-phosphoribosylamino)uracil reductase RibD [Elizabethkingia sp. JS20170427COW]|uniref:bifunctional diaminohydroxyphosphoribosylaminopyrimidine deaminase/5-amino-6-(5-phosphoribosylamino)uracil reductase RibD n=1 Tax=Elizabethkingia sp. JS20170427COW TaxID=2583851 RepID=UPI0011100736|nr:bifunctional diaminohydroxyphosphoribosylaminopyrimidine deaminase/5-amino-6-(5-phosphoribosylamino)uracil reductase RibD [Elizabethkingia sp. JS20170427COW]QCX53694.1 bifunctional diaminohydroxyphosphoribosylaminopyrimidine deaminase/5-amino-6-(5-phosphoribosylamino)uracil reductase RibD [Elizabethkingia sp. JS20170427COW]
MQQYEKYMRRALQLAQKAIGNTYPNPLVGSVIVHQDRIIGEGWHHKAGEAHAEVNAINSVKDKELLKQSTIYVTLEPCAHYGKTPPCALKIIEMGIPKVVIGSLDPHDKVNGKGISMLKEAGVEVVSGVLKEECDELNKRFFCYQQKKRPYLILKWAQSVDGFMDSNFQPYAISNALSQQVNHQLRAHEHAILVGTSTILHDNPNLTIRHYSGQNPIRVIIDKELKIPESFKIFNQEAVTWIFNRKIDKEEGNTWWIKIDVEQEVLPQLMDILYQQQVQSLIVEGGAATLSHFLKSELWDEIWVFEAEDLVLHQGTKAPELKYQPTSVEILKDNILKKYKKDNLGI